MIPMLLGGEALLSRHKLSPKQELVFRWPERNEDAEIRVVSPIGVAAHSENPLAQPELQCTLP